MIGTNSGLLPGQPYQIKVLVKNSGFAIQNNVYSFDFLPKIISFSPSSGIYSYTFF